MFEVYLGLVVGIEEDGVLLLASSIAVMKRMAFGLCQYDHVEIPYLQ